jgi:hypothetical protein
VRYGLPTHISAPRPKRDENATPQAVLVIGLGHAFTNWAGIKQMTAVLDMPARQCAWCGLILTGLWQGTTLLHVTDDGPRPYLLPGYSHGLCEECRDAVYLQWRQSRATKISGQPSCKDKQCIEHSLMKLLFTTHAEKYGGASCLETICV